MEARLCWRSKRTGAAGAGSWQPLESVKASKKIADELYKEIIEHWIEERK